MSAHWDFNMNFFGGWVEGWSTNIQTIAASVLEGREGLLVQLFNFQSPYFNVAIRSNQNMDVFAPEPTT